MPIWTIIRLDVILQTITKIYRIIYSSKDYEKLWQKYPTEGIDKNMTLQMFCLMNNIPYNSFDNYLKTRGIMSNIHPISITDLPIYLPSA